MLGVLCASIGSIQVNEAIKLLTGIGDPLVGKLMIYDALEMEYRKLKVRKDPNCALCGENPTVTELIDYDAFCGAISDEAADAAAGVDDLGHPARAHAQGARRTASRDFVLVDVREPNEYEINRIPGSVLIPKGDFLNGNALRRSSPADRRQQADRAALQVRRALGRGAGGRQGRRLRRRRARRRRRGGLGQPDRPVASRRTDATCRRRRARRPVPGPVTSQATCRAGPLATRSVTSAACLVGPGTRSPPEGPPMQKSRIRAARRARRRRRAGRRRGRATTAPARPPRATRRPTPPTIHPGTMMYTDGAQCTANFVYTDGAGTTYVGYAAHCAGTGAATDTDGCSTQSLPLGTKVDLQRGRQPGRRGHPGRHRHARLQQLADHAEERREGRRTPAPTTTSRW